MLLDLFSMWPFTIAGVSAAMWGFVAWRSGSRHSQRNSIVFGTAVGFLSAVYMAIVGGALAGASFLSVVDALGRAFLIVGAIAFAGSLSGLLIGELINRARRT